MNIDSTTGQIIDEITLLAEADRVRGRIEVDGIVVVDSSANEVLDDSTAAWDQYGFSPPNENGCVMIQAVEKRRAEYLASESEFENQTARERAQWYAIIIKGREYDEAILQNIWSNLGLMGIISGLFGEYHIGAYRHMNPQWIHEETGDLKHALTYAEQISHEWNQNPNYQGDVIPNHAVAIRGNDANPRYPRWETHFVPGLAPQILKNMANRVKGLERQASRKGRGPTVGPR